MQAARSARLPEYGPEALDADLRLLPPNLVGLTEAQAAARRAPRGNGRPPPGTGRTYAQIVRENVFTFINNVLFGLGIALVLLGHWTDALVSVGVVAVNLLVGVVQEVRAKRTLDRIALLTRPTATVIRDGQARSADPRGVVVGDLLVLTPGDQVVADGVVVSDGRMEVDESLLTGESDAVPKTAGDALYSGSFCVSGSGAYEARRVGTESLAMQMTADARAFRRVLTPLQQRVHLVVRIILLMAVTFGIGLVADAFVEGLTLAESVRMAVVIAGLVPNGLFLAIAVAYALAAVRVAGRGALVQQANAIESLSHVDMLCLDKTGTLTTGSLRLLDLRPIGINEHTLRQSLGDYVASGSVTNRTADAIAAACTGQRRRVRDEVPFSSERKWSALMFADDALSGGYVLGAPEALLPLVDAGPEIATQIETWAERGLRVLLFAHDPQQQALHDPRGLAVLPSGLRALGVLSMADELRPGACDTLAAFTAAGVALKLISGDHPATVRALALQVGFPAASRSVSGSDLAALDAEQLRRVAAETAVFGRVSPRQKEQLVHALHESGHYVGMVGDGVNDVAALKRADLAIALQSGSQAARAVADLVLLDNSFAVLPAAVGEGQRIVRGLLDILRLFLVRVSATALLIVGVSVLGAGFPLGPKHNALLALLTVGIPTIALVAWARPGIALPDRLLHWVLHFVAPAAWSLAAVGLAVYVAFLVPARTEALRLPSGPEQASAILAAQATAQTAVTVVSILCGLLLVIFAEPPTPAWTGGAPLSGDWRPTLLASGLLVVFLAVLAVPRLSAVFDLSSLAPAQLTVLACVTVIWAGTLRWAWRARLLERVLNLE